MSEATFRQGRAHAKKFNTVFHSVQCVIEYEGLSLMEPQQLKSHLWEAANILRVSKETPSPASRVPSVIGEA